MLKFTGRESNDGGRIDGDYNTYGITSEKITKEYIILGKSRPMKY
jgi:hypothetical protein